MTPCTETGSFVLIVDHYFLPDPDGIDVIHNIDSWSKDQNAIARFPCKGLKESTGNGEIMTLDSWFILTESNIFILKELKSHKGFARVVAKRPLDMIVQITSKKKIPNLITFKYGETCDPSPSPAASLGPNIIATDCLLFTKPYEVTRLVKAQVIKVLDNESGGDKS